MPDLPEHRPPQPQVEEGFEHVNRYYDKVHHTWAAKILPGEFYVSGHGELIGTVLGSCIGVCARDVCLGIGGMNHFMLPEDSPHLSKQVSSNTNFMANNYGKYAMNNLLNRLLAMGAFKKNLEIKIFGGGQVVERMTDIGARNIEFVRGYLHREGLSIKAAQVGGACSRKIWYYPDTGEVLLRRIVAAKNDTIVNREKSYMLEIERQKNGREGS